MKIRLSITLFFLFSFVLTFAQKLEKTSAMHDLTVDLVYLSSDFLEGRNTGTLGEERAARYIATRFEEIGLKPYGQYGSWFQPFPFKERSNPHAANATPPREGVGKNVIAYLDNNSDNTVIIGGHYDHLGYGGNGSRATGEPAIHNGADDNASGIAALLALAEYFKNSDAKENNYLFLAFSGEEMGLFGSKHFVGDPTIELGKVNYMINMDMIGRLNEEKVLAINGAGTSPVWKETLEKIDVDGIKAKTSDSGIGPSDHTSFYLKDIPVLHFFTGQHMDYHKPEDDAHLINFEGLYSVTNYIIELIHELDDDGKLAFTKTKDESKDQKAASFKVTLGVMPDYVYDGVGMRIDGIIDDRPAQKAGLKGGDILVKIGDLEVKDIYDYMKGLSMFNKGEKTTVVVKRGDEKVTTEVVF